MDGVTLVKFFFFEYFCILYQFSFDQPLHTHPSSFGAGTVGPLVTGVPGGLSLTPPYELEALLCCRVTELENQLTG
jgi:hypothetical protein